MRLAHILLLECACIIAEKCCLTYGGLRREEGWSCAQLTGKVAEGSVFGQV